MNGRTVRDTQFMVSPEKDKFTVDGRPMQKDGWQAVLLNKPKAVVTTASDEIASPTALVERVTGKGLLLLAPANAARRRFWIYNDSHTTLRVKFGLGAGEQSFTHLLLPGSLYESKGYPVYTGIITGYGRPVAAQVTEI